MERHDRRSALLCLGFAVAVGVEAYRLDPGTLGNPGPGLAPLLFASVLAGLSAILWARSLGRGKPLALVFQWRPVLAILATLLAYGLAIEWLGYLVCTFVGVALLVRGAGEPSLRALVFAGVVTAGVYLVFVRWLAVPLPTGLIFP